MTTSHKYIPLDEPNLQGNERKYLNECIDTNWISFQGAFVGRVEDSMAKICGTKHGLSIVNGTYALVLALQALDIKKGDEVIVPTLTMSASVFCISAVGATPVFVDSLPDQMTLDPQDVAKKVTSKTKAIITVHLYGRVCDIDKIRSVAPGIPIIEDCAEALGANYKGKPVGGIGTIGCHSYHNKVVASGEGGAITLNDDKLAQALKDLRTPPPNNQDGAPILALNNRMSNVAAAVALGQLERLSDLVAKRKAVAAIYEKKFQKVKGLSVFVSPSYEDCCFWRFQVLIEKEYPISREQLIAKLESKKIASRSIFTAMHLHGFYAKDYGHLKFPNAAHLAARGLDLPSSPNLKPQEVEMIADLIAHPEKA